MKDEDLTQGKPWISILRFAFPLMFAYILQQLYNTADMFVLGNFDSQNSLAAVGSCFNIAGLYTMLAVGLSLGVGILVSQAFGAKNEDDMQKYAGNGCILLMIFGLFFSVLSYSTSKWVLKEIIDIPDVLEDSAVLYAQLYSVGLFFQFGYNAFAAILRAVGNSKSSLYFLMITTTSNILFDVLFVVVFKKGVQGIAVATIISQALAMFISFIYMIKKYPVFKPLKQSWYLNYTRSIESIKTGIPLSFQAIIINIGFMFLLKIANSFGENMTISFTVANRLEFYMLVPIIAVWNAVSTFTGQNYGAKKHERLLLGLKQTIKINLVIAFIIGAFCFCFASSLAGFFGIQGTSLAYATIHLKVIAVDLFFYALYGPITAVSAGIKRSYIATIASIIELGGRIAFALILSCFIGKASIWFNEPIAWAMVVIFVYIYYFTSLKKAIINH